MKPFEPTIMARLAAERGNLAPILVQVDAYLKLRERHLQRTLTEAVGTLERVLEHDGAKICHDGGMALGSVIAQLKSVASSSSSS